MICFSRFGRWPVSSRSLLALTSLLLILTNADCVLSQTAFRVLPQDFNSDKTQQMMRSYLRERAHEALDRRREELNEALTEPAKLAEYQRKRLAFLRWTMGKMPERCPLNAQVKGTLDDDGFTIEKLLFESQPGFHITANVYRPDGQGPFPAILHPLGHTDKGKAYGAYQRVNRLLARHGFLVLCFDPIGQGERKQLLDIHGKPTLGASGEHQQLGVAPILLGRSLASYMVFDGVRALDYLCSRPDVDPKRIGCTGNSGGGNMTSYLMAYDDRIAVAAPGCFLTTHRRKNERPGPGDAEQNLYAQIRDGFDHPDFIITRAPKPTLILAATNDFVPIEGAWDAFRQAKRVYTQLGHPERVELIEAAAKHGFSRRLREGAVRFFARWLQQRQVEVLDDEEDSIRTELELRVTPEGQVLRMPHARSMHDLFRDHERRLAKQRPQLTRSLVRRVASVRELNKLPEPKVDWASHRESKAAKDVDGVASEELPQKLIFHPEPGIVLPGLFWPKGEKAPYLMAPGRGLNSASVEAAKLNAQGHPVLIVDVRDIGETATKNWRFFGADYFIAHMLGQSWLGMRTEDLLVCGRWLKQRADSESVCLAASGETGPAALHAAALAPDLFASVRTTGGLRSWRELIESTRPQPHIHNAVHGAVQFYDLPDLVKLHPPPANRPDNK